MAALNIALGGYGHTAALLDGSVRPQGVDLEFVEVSPIIAAFRRMVRGLEFDVAEMAITTYLCARAYGKPFTAIPVFPVRAFHHGAIVYNTKAGVSSPKDLEGKKVGVNRGYTVTTGLWIRGILQSEYGLDVSKVTWMLSGDEHVAEYEYPANVVPIAEGQTLEEMLLSGEIAAAIGVSVGSEDVKPLIADARNAAFESFRKTGLYPINHTVVVKDEVLQATPSVATALFDAFVAAKKPYLDRLASGQDLSDADRGQLAINEVVGSDPTPYGIAPNRQILETVIQHAVDQKVIPQAHGIEDYFAANTLDLVG